MEMRPSFLDSSSLSLLVSALERLGDGFARLPDAGKPLPEMEKAGPILLEVAERLKDNFPYFHPLYAGQMLKPPHPIARLAYFLAMWINPNNHALDGGRASSAMEKEAVAQLAGMFGWDEHLGHLCGGGTMANLEALWISGQINPGRKVVASSQAHYTHSRISGVLKLDFETLPCDGKGRMDVSALKERLRKGGVGTVVATIGTTATGSVDPLPEILDLKKEFGFRLHADAAYGGYFRLVGNLGEATKASFRMLSEVDSLVIDPHKHGMQPYGCGCVLFRDPSVGRFYKHDSPYTYFSSRDLHLGEISLECSRPGAAAVALWATQKLLPLVPEGDFARMLSASRAAAVEFHHLLAEDPLFLPAFPPELDIVTWIPRATTVREASEKSQRIFIEAGKRDLHLALATLPTCFFDLQKAGIESDRDTVTCFRSALMKPEHKEWLPRILALLRESSVPKTGASPK